MRLIYEIFYFRYKTWDKIKEMRKFGYIEGLSTLRAYRFRYELLQIEKKLLFTRFFVSYNQTAKLSAIYE
jgi:hypothetical protein